MCLRRLANKIRSLFMANPKDFLLNTDYEMDKIVYFKEGEFTGSADFEHNLSFEPLIFGVWSTNSDFSSSNALCLPATSNIPGAVDPLGVYAYVSGSNGHIKIESMGENSGTTKIYYRIYAFEPQDSHNSAPHTSSQAKEFVLNTDYNYRKLKASGTFTQANEEYKHGLGYIPHVEAWIKWSTYLGGDLDHLNWASNFNKIYITVTPDKIKLSPVGANIIEKIYWRIYYDET